VTTDDGPVVEAASATTTTTAGPMMYPFSLDDSSNNHGSSKRNILDNRKKETHGLSSYFEKLPASEALTSPDIYPRSLGSVSVRQGTTKVVYGPVVYRKVYGSPLS
jgi:hypothetical protein